jgi:uncharacterized protein YjiS (DUF1127 family)
MATTYTPAVAPFGAITVHRAVTAVSKAIASFSAWNDRRRSVDALRQLDAHLLDDIGLTRGDI